MYTHVYMCICVYVCIYIYIYVYIYCFLKRKAKAHIGLLTAKAPAEANRRSSLQLEGLPLNISLLTASLTIVLYNCLLTAKAPAAAVKSLHGPSNALLK